MIVVADTSGLLAAIDADDREHSSCRNALARASLVVVSPLVLAELDHLVGKHLGEDLAINVAEHAAAQAGAGSWEVPQVSPAVLEASCAVRLRYRGLAVGLTDAVNVVLAAQYSTDTLLTLDRRHYRAVRPIDGHSSFRLLPDDLAG